MAEFNNPYRHDVEEVVDVHSSKSRSLVLHNDEFHTFDYVIDSLIEICNHDLVQAEQCTMIVHYKGKCDVKAGQYAKLKPMREQLVEKGLTATID
ncbi:MAG: ATP-dependent Clp protease adaptor ClpS [Bacteroidales bacterium]|nr:ATP-dependent Clp protease adaptor ClpS [Bacteroidales bacterium]